MSGYIIKSISFQRDQSDILPMFTVNLHLGFVLPTKQQAYVPPDLLHQVLILQYKTEGGIGVVFESQGAGHVIKP